MVLRVLLLCGLAVVVFEHPAQTLPTPNFSSHLAHGLDRFDQTVSDPLMVPPVSVVVFPGDGSFAMKPFCARGRNPLVSQTTSHEGVTAHLQCYCAWGAQKVTFQEERKSHKLLSNKDFQHEIGLSRINRELRSNCASIARGGAKSRHPRRTGITQTLAEQRLQE